MDNSSSSSSVANVTTDSSPHSMMPESELILVYAKVLYGNYYETIFPITLVICVLGLVTNVFNITVFTRQHMVNSLNFFLAALAVFDIILISSQLPYTIHYLFGFQSIFAYGWVRSYIFFIFLELFGTMVCNWLAVIIGIWRNLTIKWPLNSNKWCSLMRARITLVVLIALGLAFSCPVFALLEVKENHLYNKSLYTKSFTEFATVNNGYNLKVFWGGLLIMTFVPCVFLIVINALLIINVCQLSRHQNDTAISDKSGDVRKRDRRSYRITLMITIILVLFVVNNLPDSALILTAFFETGNNDEAKNKIREATDFLRVFSMLNNALSFFVYYFLGERRFKRTFLAIFCSRCSKNTYSPGKRQPSSESLSTESLEGAYAEAPL